MCWAIMVTCVSLSGSPREVCAGFSKWACGGSIPRQLCFRVWITCFVIDPYLPSTSCLVELSAGRELVVSWCVHVLGTGCFEHFYLRAGGRKDGGPGRGQCYHDLNCWYAI